jgi:hypothetical protein
MKKEEGKMPEQPPVPEVWTLSFKNAAGFAAPIEVRVRRLLKAALRSYGLRCTRIWPPPVDPDRQTKPPLAA